MNAAKAFVTNGLDFLSLTEDPEGTACDGSCLAIRGTFAKYTASEPYTGIGFTV